jgi:hypothetical protein
MRLAIDKLRDHLNRYGERIPEIVIQDSKPNTRDLNGFSIGPLIRYEFIRRLYDTLEGRRITDSWGITSMSVLHFGIMFDLPIRKKAA